MSVHGGMELVGVHGGMELVSVHGGMELVGVHGGMELVSVHGGMVCMEEASVSPKEANANQCLPSLIPILSHYTMTTR